MTVLEGHQIVTDNTTCAEILNTFFIESVQNLEIDREMHVNKETILGGLIYRPTYSFHLRLTIPTEKHDF